MVGLYRDDGLMLVKGSKGRSADKARKELHRIFDQFGLKITAVPMPTFAKQFRSYIQCIIFVR